ncbi:MAG: PQQ-binding-like beta-propeller repeat protein, partial [Planctomycetota bacterium]|jgi:outer membrane protein assembly factor BamB
VVVYAGSSSGYVYAFDGADGKEIWKLRLHARVLGSPVLRADRLYVVTSDTLGGAETKDREGRVLALDRGTGKEIWNVRVGAAIDHAPAVSGGRLFVGAEDGAVHSLDERSGEAHWKVMLDSPVAGPPVAIGDRVVLTATDGSVCALEEASGKLLWRAEHEGLRPTVPAAGDDVAYVGFRPGKGPQSGVRGLLVALDAKTGKARWRFSESGAISARPVVGGDAVYALSHDGHVYAVAAASGRLTWKRRLAAKDLRYSSRLVCGPVVARDVLYVLCGGLHALSMATGEALWSVPIDGRSNGLAVMGDLLVMGTYCLGPARKPSGPGPVHGIDARTGRARWRVEKRFDGFVGVPALAVEE